MPSTNAVHPYKLNSAAFDAHLLQAVLPQLARLVPALLLIGCALVQGPAMFPEPLDGLIVVLLLWAWSEICIRLLPRRAVARTDRRPLNLPVLRIHLHR